MWQGSYAGGSKTHSTNMVVEAPFIRSSQPSLKHKSLSKIAIGTFLSTAQMPIAQHPKLSTGHKPKEKNGPGAEESLSFHQRQAQASLSPTLSRGACLAHLRSGAACVSARQLPKSISIVPKLQGNPRTPFALGRSMTMYPVGSITINPPIQISSCP